MIAWDYDPGAGLTVVYVVNTAAATGNIVYGPFTVITNCGYVSPPPPVSGEPAPRIRDDGRWGAAEARSRQRARPGPQRATFLERELKTKTRNRRFT